MSTSYLTAKQTLVSGRKHHQWWCLQRHEKAHSLPHQLPQTGCSFGDICATPPPPSTNTHTHTHTHTPLCVFRFPVVRRGGWQECVCVYGVKVVRRLLWSDEGALEGEGTLCQLPGPGALKHWDFFFFFEYVRETVWVWCETMSRCNPEKTKRVILYWFALKESKRKENPASDRFTPLSLSSHFSVGISRQTWP